MKEDRDYYMTGGTARDARTGRIVRGIKNPDEFWNVGGVPRRIATGELPPGYGKKFDAQPSHAEQQRRAAAFRTGAEAVGALRKIAGAVRRVCEEEAAKLGLQPGEYKFMPPAGQNDETPHSRYFEKGGPGSQMHRLAEGKTSGAVIELQHNGNAGYIGIELDDRRLKDALEGRNAFKVVATIFPFQRHPASAIRFDIEPDGVAGVRIAETPGVSPLRVAIAAMYKGEDPSRALQQAWAKEEREANQARRANVVGASRPGPKDIRA